MTKILRRPPKSSEPPKSYVAVHPFDRQHGTDTSGLFSPEDLPSGTRTDLYNTGYFGVAPSAFRQILNKLALNYAEYTFLDLGSGKGRALLLAAEYPFQAVIGVELAPKLHAIAASNICRDTSPVRACDDIRTIQGDASEFPFPSGRLVVYLWNPFQGPVFARFVANLEAAIQREQREIYILYIQPDLEDQLDLSPFLRKLWREEFQMSEEDYAAHAFPPRGEVCSVYVSIPAPAIPNAGC